MALKGALTDAIRREEMYWKIKSINQWLQEGDKNTKFIHAKTVQRRHGNKIRGLEDEHGVWCEEKGEIEGIALRYFERLFTYNQEINLEEIMVYVDCKIT